MPTDASVPAPRADALPFTLAGRVLRGKGLGATLGFPTANLAHPPEGAIPPDGVYVAVAEARGRRYAAVLNQGRHPTSPEGRPTVEAHLLNYAGGPLYGEALVLRYERFLRPEKRFANLNALRAQLDRDRADAQAWAEAHPEALQVPSTEEERACH